MTAPAPTSLDEFVLYLTTAVGAPDLQLEVDEPLVDLAIGDSLTLTELAVVLEQELGVDLSDDLDLRWASFAALYARYSDRSQHA